MMKVVKNFYKTSKSLKISAKIGKWKKPSKKLTRKIVKNVVEFFEIFIKNQ